MWYKKKYFRVILLIIGILMLLVLLLNIYAGRIAERFVRDTLAKHPIPGLKIDFERINLFLVSRSFNIKDVSIRSVEDSAFIPFINKYGFDIKIDKVNINGVRILKAVRSRDFIINSVEIGAPVLKILHFQEAKPEEAKDPANVTEDTLKSKPFNTLALGNFKILNGILDIHDVEDSLSLILTDNINFLLSGLVLDNSNPVTGMQLNYKEFQVHLDEHDMLLDDKMYKLYVKDLKVDKNDSLITIGKLMLKPEYDKYEFGRMKGKQVDVNDLEFTNMEITGIDLDKFITRDSLFIRKFDVDSINALIFRDKRLEFDFDNFPKLPNQALKSLKLPVVVEKFKIHNGLLTYEEHKVLTDEPGTVYFTDLSIGVEHISSNRDYLAINPVMIIELNGKLYGEGLLNGIIEMPVLSENDQFTMRGNLGGLDIKRVNAMIKPEANIEFMGGYASSAVFSATLNNDYSMGEITVVYKDLDVNVLKNKAGKEDSRSGFLSFMANEFIRKNNPSGKKDPHKAAIYFERDKNKGIGNYLWKTLFSGVKETLLPIASHNEGKVRDQMQYEHGSKSHRHMRKGQGK